MSMSSNNTKVVTGQVTFCYLNCWEPHATDGRTPRYSVCLLIPKGDTRTVEKIRAAMQNAYEAGRYRLAENGGRVPAFESLRLPLRDGDAERPKDPLYKNCWFMNASSATAPGIVDAQCRPITERGEMYSGVKGRASVSLYAYSFAGNRGIACGLNNLQKLADGTPLSRKSCAEEDFLTADDDSDGFLS